jgi:hypothetical protein
MISTRKVTFLFEKLMKQKTPEHQPLALVYDCNFDNSTIFFEQMLTHQGYSTITSINSQDFLDQEDVANSIVQHLIELCTQKPNEPMNNQGALILHNYQELDTDIQLQLVKLFKEQAEPLFKKQQHIVPLLMASCHHVICSKDYDYHLIELDIDVDHIHALCDIQTRKQQNAKTHEQKSRFF